MFQLGISGDQVTGDIGTQHAGKKRKHSDSNQEVEGKTDGEAELQCSINTQKQLAWAQHLLKELEGAHASVQAEKVMQMLA